MYRFRILIEKIIVNQECRIRVNSSNQQTTECIQNLVSKLYSRPTEVTPKYAPLYAQNVRTGYFLTMLITSAKEVKFSFVSVCLVTGLLKKTID